MAIRSFRKMWTEAKSEEKALRVFERVRRTLGREALDRSVEPYPKITGFVVAFWIELESQAWNDSVVEVIALGQGVGYQGPSAVTSSPTRTAGLMSPVYQASGRSSG